MIDVRWREKGNHVFRATVAWNNSEADAALYYADDISLWCLQNLGKERRMWQRMSSYEFELIGRRPAMLFKLRWIGA